MLAGNIVQESRAHFNNGLPFEPHQTISVFSIIYGLPSWHFRTALKVYTRENVCFFVTYIKAAPSVLYQKPRRFNDNFLACVERCHVETLITNSRYKFQGSVLWQSHRHLSGHWAPYHTGFSFQIHIKVPGSQKRRNISLCRDFELATAWMETLIRNIFTTE